MNLGKPMRYIEGWSVLLFVIVIGGARGRGRETPTLTGNKF